MSQTLKRKPIPTNCSLVESICDRISIKSIYREGEIERGCDGDIETIASTLTYNGIAKTIYYIFKLFDIPLTSPLPHKRCVRIVIPICFQR